MIRGVWDAGNPRDAVRAYLSELKLGEGEHT